MIEFGLGHILKGDFRMAKKRFQAEQIIGKLREAEVEVSKGQTIGQIVKNVEGGSKRRRRESVGAVEIGGAHWSSSEKWQDGGVSPYSAQLRREAQECDPTWSFGKRFVGRC
jgi:hypothetical protein